MKVAELIKSLEKMPQDREVTIVVGSDGPYTKERGVGEPWFADGVGDVRIQAVVDGATPARQ